MERLSEKAIEIINELHTERLDYESEYLPLIDCAQQCAAYEDTGLTPDAVAQLKQIAEIFNCDPNDHAQLKQLCDKLRGWKQAEQAGRLVVLPCKIGEMWDFEDGKTMEILGFHINRWADLSVLHCVDGDDPEDDDSLRSCNPTYFLAHFTRHEAEAAVEQRKEGLNDA